MAAMKFAYRINKTCEFAWLEDGSNAYFHNGAPSGGLGRNIFLQFIRKHLLSCLYRLYDFYDLGRCFGDHKLLTKLYVTFPKCVREELKHKECCEISQKQFLNGIQFMYGDKPFTMLRPSVVFAMDKLNVYGDRLTIIDKMIKKKVEKAIKECKIIYCKYHPRESEKLPALSHAIELNSKIAIEYYLANTTDKDMTLIGIKSTSLQTAKKMGFKVVSLIQSLNENNKEIIDFYNKIQIMTI
jgi:hypothetical protein